MADGSAGAVSCNRGDSDNIPALEESRACREGELMFGEVKGGDRGNAEIVRGVDVADVYA